MKQRKDKLVYRTSAPERAVKFESLTGDSIATVKPEVERTNSSVSDGEPECSATRVDHPFFCNRHRRRLIAGTLVGLLLFAACNDDWLTSGSKSDRKNTVSFVLRMSDINTRLDNTSTDGRVIATHVYNLHDTSPEGEPLMLMETVTAIGNQTDSPLATRGTCITEDNFKDNFGKAGFTAIPFNISKDKTSYETYELGPAQFTYDENKDAWTHFYNNNIMWVDGGIYYVLYAGKKLYDDNPSASVNCSVPNKNTSVEGNDEVKFHYKMNASDESQDLLFTTAHITKDGTKKGITFYHMLTAIRFQDGYMDTNSSINHITGVQFSNLMLEGDCSFKVDPEKFEPVVTSGKADVAWDVSGSTCGTGYRNTFNADEGTNDNGRWTSPNSKYMWVIPQTSTSSNEIKMTVYYRFGDEDQTREKTVSIPSSMQWKAGELHTFTINPVNVEPLVEMKENTSGKCTAAITNMGNYPVYMRAAIIPTWTDNEGYDNYVTWEETLTVNNKWVLKDDGFYYYNQVVDHQQSLNLLEEYEIPTAPNSGAKLQITVVAQSVKAIEMNDESGNPVETKFTTIGWKNPIPTTN